MTQEEKAKRYDEAIKRIENIKTGKCEITFMFTEDLFEYIFPEFAESEDEKIRKEILDFCKNRAEKYPNDPKYKNISAWIDWLEKQCEKDKEILVLKDQIESLHAAIKAIKETHRIELEKQGEQKPNPYSGTSFEYNGHTWGMCARDNGVDILRDKHIVGHLEKQGEQNLANSAKTCKVEQKPADEEMKELLQTEYEKGRADAIAEMQNPWSEEDEVALGDALWCCKQAASIAKDENDMGNLWCAERWLKSLKERYTWKPSDEQMEALEHFIVYHNGSTNYAKDLEELRLQLKKLKDEK